VKTQIKRTGVTDCRADRSLHRDRKRNTAFALPEKGYRAGATAAGEISRELSA